MTQIFFPYKEELKQPKTYCYINNFTSVVVVKINGLDDRECERVVFPQEKFLFMANEDCKLEVYQHSNLGIIKDIVSCCDLQRVEN